MQNVDYLFLIVLRGGGKLEKSQKHYNAMDKTKRKFRVLLSKLPVFNVHFGQIFFRNSVHKKLSHRPKENNQSYPL